MHTPTSVTNVNMIWDANIAANMTQAAKLVLTQNLATRKMETGNRKRNLCDISGFPTHRCINQRRDAAALKTVENRRQQTRHAASTVAARKLISINYLNWPPFAFLALLQRLYEPTSSRTGSRRFDVVCYGCPRVKVQSLAAAAARPIGPHER